MRLIRFLVIGVFFGIVLTKSEVISWYRIQEMFRFQSFHMYGIIGSAVIISALIIKLIHWFNFKSVTGESISLKPKALEYKAALIGGTIFGLGWALTGACPGPIYILIGNGFSVFIVVMIAAALGSFLYGVMRSRLPH